MSDVRSILRDLVAKARAVHYVESDALVTSLELIGRLDRMNAAVNLGMTSEQFAAAIGLSLSQLWKRTQAARVVRSFPEVKDLLARRELCLSVVSMISPKLSQANKGLVLAGIKGKTKREARAFLSRVTLDGSLREEEAEVDVIVTLAASDSALLKRAREVLAVKGKAPSDVEVVRAALKLLCTKEDPREAKDANAPALRLTAGLDR